MVCYQKTIDLSNDEKRTFLSLKEEMLDRSRLCYNNASHCDEDDSFEEAWLHHYMLGKISEKLNDSPSVYLDHYQKVSPSQPLLLLQPKSLSDCILPW